jgi:hypothetical protein
MFDAGTIAVLAPFLMIIGIVWVTSHAKLEEKRIAAAAARKDGPQDTATLERVKYLEERVRILERIVTDGGYDLAHKIEALRDERRVEELLETRESERSN